jgi:hypothetical protein
MPTLVQISENYRTTGETAILDMRVELTIETRSIGALCGIWANCKLFLLATRRRADRVMPEFGWTRVLSFQNRIRESRCLDLKT